MFDNIAIIGAGLMGVSLYKTLAAKKNIKNLILLAKNQEQVKSLARLDIMASTDYLQLKNIEFIIIATPLKSYQAIINNLKSIINKQVIITDIGSVKTPIIELFKQQAPNFTFVPAHPIAGSQKSGVGSLVTNLYQNKQVIITDKENAQGVKETKLFWQEIGMNVEFLTAQEHDKIYAYMSHIIQKIAFNIDALFNMNNLNITNIKKTDQLFYKFTRLADSNPILWQDIFKHNQPYLIEAKQGFLQNIATYYQLLKNDNFNELINQIKLANSKKNIKTIIKHNIIADDLPYYIFAIIIATAIINNIKDPQYFAYAGTGFNDMVAIITIINLLQPDNFLRSQEKILLLLKDFHSKFK